MAILKNQRHEKLAQNIAKGMSLVDAFAAVGYARHDSNSSTLSARPDIRARVKELQEKAVSKTLVTIEKLTDELEEARLLSMKDEKGAAAAVSAIMAKAKLHGLDIQKGAGVTGTIHLSFTADDANL